jgi:hypothetical protein
MGNTASITVDGVLVGTIVVGPPDKLPSAPSTAPLATPHMASLGNPAAPFHHGRGTAPSTHGNRATAPHGHGAVHEKHGPTFRHGVTPRGAADPDKPKHFTLGDVKSDSENWSAYNPGGGSAYLKHERFRMQQEVQKDPALAAELRGLAVAEDSHDPAGVVESLANRAAYTGKSIRELMHNGFYGPMNRGTVRPNNDPRVQSAIDTVWGGSNRLKGATDQGMAGDPNAAWQGGRIMPPGGTPGAIFNDWGGGPGGHEGSRLFREEQQRRVQGGGSAVPQQQTGVTRLPSAPQEPKATASVPGSPL